MIDEGVCDILDVFCPLKELDGDEFPCLVIQLGEGGFVADFEGVKGIF